VAQHPAVRRGCIIVAHTQTGARRLPNVSSHFPTSVGSATEAWATSRSGGVATEVREGESGLKLHRGGWVHARVDEDNARCHVQYTISVVGLDFLRGAFFRLFL
jgi:hypothetical protein